MVYPSIAHPHVVVDIYNCPFVSLSLSLSLGFSTALRVRYVITRTNGFARERERERETLSNLSFDYYPSSVNI